MLSVVVMERVAAMNYNFDSELAKQFGVNEAIMLGNFIFWLRKNKANNENFFDGTWWTYNSVKAYSELFEFWSADQIKRILKSLVDQGVLIVANYHEDKYNRSNWYALSNEYIHLIHGAKSHHALGDFAQSNRRNNPMSLGENAKYLSLQIENTDKKPDITPLTPQGDGENKVAGKPVEKGSNLIIADPSQNPNFYNQVPTEQQIEAAVNTWLTMIEDKIKTKNWIGFTRFEMHAIQFRARQFPKLRAFEIENELVLIDKLAWEGKDIENVLRSGYRSLASVKAVLRTEHDSAGNRIYDLERLNAIRQNKITQDKTAQGTAA